MGDVTEKLSVPPRQADCDEGCAVMAGPILVTLIAAVLLLLSELVQAAVPLPDDMPVIVMVVEPAFANAAVVNEAVPGVATVTAAVSPVAALGAPRL